MSPNAIAANLGVNFRFYARNRLLLAATSLVFVLLALTTIPNLFTLTSAQHLELITSITQSVSGFAVLLGVGLIVLHISHHVSNRSLKMIITKPCPVDTWLLASALSAWLVVTVVYMLLLAAGTALFWIWSIPFQSGFLFVILREFASALIWMSYALLLAVVVKPVTALLVLFIFQEGLFYWLKLLLTSAEKSQSESFDWLITAARVVVELIYFVLPMTNPFDEKAEYVYKSLRGADAVWWTLAPSWIYAIGIWLFSYLLAVRVLSNKRLT